MIVEFTKRIVNRLRYEYRQRIVKERYPMLTTLSMKEWREKDAWGCVFTLHHVEEKDPQGIPANQVYKISPEFLEEIILKYKNKGYNFVSLDTISEMITSGRKPDCPFIAFTLDDGYVDNYTNALPVFEKHQVPFCIFLATDFADKKAILWWDSIEELIRLNHAIPTSDGKKYSCDTFGKRCKTFNSLKSRILQLDQSRLQEELPKLFCNNTIDWYAPIKEKGLSWQQVKDLSEHPLCTIGGHSVSHPAFNILSRDKVRYEIQNGISRIEEHTGKKICHFSYPYGSPNIIFEREYRLVEEFPIKTAFCAYGGCITDENRNVTHLPRVTLREP